MAITAPVFIPQVKVTHIKTIISNPLVLPKLSPTRIWRKDTKACFGGTFNDAFLHWPNIADFRAEAGHTLHISPKIKDEGTLRLFTEAEATGLIQLQQGYFLLHASCILINRRAYIFVGTPGAGKSTTVAAFVKAGNAPLADDMTVITFQDGKPFVVPQGSAIKIWENSATNLNFEKEKLKPCFEGHNKYYYEFEGEYSYEPVPLGGIYVLNRSNRYAKNPVIPSSQVPFELLKHFPLPHQLLKDKYLQKHFIECLQIARNVPVIRQKRPEGFENLMNWVKNFSA